MPFDHALLARRGANLCGADDFQIVACASCQGHYLYNGELKDVYYAPGDLQRRFFRIAAIALPPCHYCGAIDWQISAAPVEHSAAQSGPWGWAIAGGVFEFKDDG